MNIALLADDAKKEMMIQLCIAYKRILGEHHLYATAKTGKLVADATDLEVVKFLSGDQGGDQQIAAKISWNEIDLVFYFRGTDPAQEVYESEISLLRLCDVYNVPVATNIATAEVLVQALDAGDFNWRDFVNPISDYNRKKKQSF